MSLTTTMPTSDGKSENFELFGGLLALVILVQNFPLSIISIVSLIFTGKYWQ